MLRGLSGPLLSHYFAEHLLPSAFAGRIGEETREAAHRRFSAWWIAEGGRLGPASSTRAVHDRAAEPLAQLLGHDSEIVSGLWSEDLDAIWRRAARAAVASGARWCACTNGRRIRLIDAARTYSRAHVEIDLERAASDPRLFAVLWGVLRADASRELIFEASARHGEAVSRSLRLGVMEAVGILLQELGAFDESLTVVYRILFLMFAESRGLVPSWHPIYRRHYTIESLRNLASSGREPRGLWESLQAIARLAHQGCRAGTLVVPAFNGRLFSPTRSPIAERAELSDSAACAALVALSTAPAEGTKVRARIDYRDLGVEQLGAVYETLLDYQPESVGTASRMSIRLRKTGDLRKATGSFYTPQPITDFVVRRTLAPLVRDRSADEILRLRVLDPSMGSGAFLVSACRFLARAHEDALVRDGAMQPHEITDADRARFRRSIAQRCLYGVDLNPTAVQLARLSLWLATLAAGKPLTFLDHHLVVGDSLIGASLTDFASRPPVGKARPVSELQRRLFDDGDLTPSLSRLVEQRRWLAETPDDRVDVVKEKERRLERAAARSKWKSVLDLWCAVWLWPDRASAPNENVFAALSDYILTGESALPTGTAGTFLDGVRAIAESRRFVHWMLEFPELYFDADGHPLANPGFDAIVGNPPWDMLRSDRKEPSDARDRTRADHAPLKRFFRDSGLYRPPRRGHLNRYQLFVERSLALLQRGGRMGLVLPSGVATDHTSADLRRQLIEQHNLEMIVGFDNRRAIFPIHRSMRFVACVAETYRPTTAIACRFGVDAAEQLDQVPGEHDPAGFCPVHLTPELIARVGGDAMAVPEVRDPIDLQIVERISFRFPRLRDAAGWGLKFGRELNASDDREHFTASAGIPVLEGKHIEPFAAHPARATMRIPIAVADRLLGAGIVGRERLAYRDIASATNRVSLIAAVLPKHVVTTHTLFCLKTFLSLAEQHFVCGLLNSYVANYLVRLVMTTHLGSTTVEEMRMPKVPRDSRLFEELSALSLSIATGGIAEEHARLQALAARAYQLTDDEFAHVLATFPLVPESERDAALAEFTRL